MNKRFYCQAHTWRSSSFWMSSRGRAGFHRGAKMKRHILFILLVLSTYLLSGTTWIRSYPWLDLCTQSYTSAQARAYNVIPAIGGGYLLQGHVEFYNNDSMRLVENVFWKIDENGNLIWRRLGNNMSPHSIVISNDVDRYYCIENEWGTSGLDVYDTDLNWLEGYQFNQVNGFDANLSDAVLTSDGLVFAAKIWTDSVILKTDFEFSLIWQGDFVTPPIWNGFERLGIHNNGSFITSGRDIIANYSPTGDTLWTIPVNDYHDEFYAMTLHSNGFINIMNRSYVIDDWTLKVIDTNGTCINEWNADLPDDMIFDTPVSMVETIDGNLVVFMSSSHPLNKLSLTGTSLWTRPYPMTKTGYGTRNILSDNAGDLIFCGGGSLGSITLIKANSDGIVANDDPQHSPPAITVKHYPNPARTHLTIEYKAENLSSSLSLEIFNIRGQLIYSSPLERGEGTISIDLLSNAAFTPGVYLYHVKDGKRAISSNKFVFLNSQP